MIYFTAHTFKCVCHCRRAMFRVLGMYNFVSSAKHDNALHKALRGQEKAAKNSLKISQRSNNKNCFQKLRMGKQDPFCSFVSFSKSNLPNDKVLLNFCKTLLIQIR